MLYIQMASLRCKRTDIRLQMKLAYPIRRKKIKKLEKETKKLETTNYLSHTRVKKEWRTNPTLPLLPCKTEQKQKKRQDRKLRHIYIERIHP